MANFTNTPNMNLGVPVVGLAPGPEYATLVNNCLTVIDSHDHTPGSGTQITPNGLNISSDLAILNNNLISIRSARFQSQVSPLSLPSDLGCLYESGVDLYYNDGVGNQIRITQSGGIAGTPGSIANLTPPASASYVSGNQTFVFQSGVTIPANLDGANLILRNLVAASPGLTLSAPVLSSDYTITLPNLPAATYPLVMNNAGQISASQAASQALAPTGSSMDYWGTSAPSGWLFCDGSAVSRVTYSALFAVIGTSCGEGDGTTTFNLPDVRGRFVRYVDGSAGRDPDAASRTASGVNGNVGNNVGSVQEDAFQGHGHNGASASALGAINGAFSGNNNGGNVNWSTTASYPTDGTNGTPRASSETRPKNIYCNCIIKT